MKELRQSTTPKLTNSAPTQELPNRRCRYPGNSQAVRFAGQPIPSSAEPGVVDEAVEASACAGDRPNCGRDLSLVSTRGKSSGAESPHRRVAMVSARSSQQRTASAARPLRLRSHPTSDSADGRLVKANSITDFLERVPVNSQAFVDAFVALLFVRSRREESGGPGPGRRGLQRQFLDSDSPNQSPPTTSPGDSRVARHCQHGVAAQLLSYSATLSSPARPSDFPGRDR